MKPSYVALGASYAAGVGSGHHEGPCWRSEGAFPLAVARGLGARLDWQACIGATVPDVIAQQLDALAEDTDWVTVSVGGNDIGFTPVLISAAQPAWMSNSETVIASARERLHDRLPGLLDALYAEVRARSPRAEVLVTTYPRLFSGHDCGLLTFFDSEEIRHLNDAAEELSECIRRAAARAGFECADVLPDFVGHATCDAEPWIHRIRWPVEESFHPNPAGHAAYARAVRRAWDVAGVPAGAADSDIEVRHGQMAGGSAPTFSMPDLLSITSLEGAARFGLNADEVARLARAMDVDPDAFPQLQEMHEQVRERRRRHRV